MTLASSRLLVCIASGALAVSGVGVIAADHANATVCATSTPQIATAFDPIDGQAGLAPEITSVSAGLDGACHLSFRAGLLAPLFSGDALFFFVNTDGNIATGDPVFDGADRAIVTVGDNISNSPPLLVRWSGVSYDFAGGTLLTKLDERGASDAALADMGIADPVQITVRVGTIFTDPFNVSFIDAAPDKGLPPLPLSVLFSAPAPPPVPAPPVAPPAPLVPLPVVAARPPTGACTSAQARVRALTRQLSQAKRQRSRAQTARARIALSTKIARLTRARGAAQRAVRGACPTERREAERGTLAGYAAEAGTVIREQSR